MRAAITDAILYKYSHGALCTELSAIPFSSASTHGRVRSHLTSTDGSSLPNPPRTIPDSGPMSQEGTRYKLSPPVRAQPHSFAFNKVSHSRPRMYTLEVANQDASVQKLRQCDNRRYPLLPARYRCFRAWTSFEDKPNLIRPFVRFVLRSSSCMIA